MTKFLDEFKPQYHCGSGRAHVSDKGIHTSYVDQSVENSHGPPSCFSTWWKSRTFHVQPPNRWSCLIDLFFLGTNVMFCLNPLSVDWRGCSLLGRNSIGMALLSFQSVPTYVSFLFSSSSDSAVENQLSAVTFRLLFWIGLLSFISDCVGTLLLFLWQSYTIASFSCVYVRVEKVRCLGIR